MYHDLIKMEFFLITCTFCALMASFVREAILALETGSLLFTIAFSYRSTRNGIRDHMYVFSRFKNIF